MAADEILTLRQVADYLRLTERTLYRLPQGGSFRATSTRGSWPSRRPYSAVGVREVRDE